MYCLRHVPRLRLSPRVTHVCAATQSLPRFPTRWLASKPSPPSSPPPLPFVVDRMLQCGGCGAKLHSRAQVAAGYIPTHKQLLAQASAAQAALSSSSPSLYSHGVICARCYGSKHYGKLIPLTQTESGDVMQSYVASLGSMDALLLLVTELADFDDSLLPRVMSQVGARSDIIVIVNKMDLLPPRASIPRILTWCRTRLRAAGVSNVVAVLPVSSRTGKGVVDAVHAIQEHRHGRHIVALGAPNTGKSSFINALLSAKWRVPTARVEAAGGTATLFLDELPAGHALGDVYTGDVTKLAVTSRSEAGGEEMSATRVYTPAARASAYSATTTATPTDASPASSTGDDVLSQERARKQSYLSRPTVTLPTRPLAPPSATAGAPGDAAPARIPFTVSALPGTTVGVIGVPWDEHGHSWVYDTPGIIANVSKQRMLESVAEQVTQARMSETTSREDKLRATRALNALVPQRASALETVALKSGRCVYIGGLARLEFVHPRADAHMLFTVCCSLPVHVTSSQRAEEVFKSHADAASSDAAVALSSPHGLFTPTAGPLSHALDVRLRDFAPAGGRGDLKGRTMSSAAASRRLHRARTALLDVQLHGIGWIAITPVEIQGMQGYDSALEVAQLKVYTCAGLRASVRAPPLLPYEATGTTPKEWRR